MVEVLVLAGLAIAGYSGAPVWLALLGAAVVTADGWWRKVRLLQQEPRVPFSSKMTTYLVVSIAINAGVAVASLLVGRAARWLLVG
jgi:hypothetical protein